MKELSAIFIALFIISAGCLASPSEQNNIQQISIQQNLKIPITLTDSGAMEAAKASSSCRSAGNLSGTYAYNEVSRTWSFDITTYKVGCAPICVVYHNKSSYVNWRCNTNLPTYES
ncbi:hypothetical protein HY988_05770 [Candidatus Micrarchaeota archaeon]|nr:hypothetical protein [Candidatus Micrarchaeota archaeon]